MTDESHRYYVRSPDGRMITGYNRPEAANAVALDYGGGAVIVDTLAQAYYPVAEEVLASCCMAASPAGAPANPTRRAT